MTDSFNLDHLTNEHKAALSELKEKFTTYSENYMHDEYYLMHWLIARKFDAKNAEAMLTKHYRYRKVLKMDDTAFRNFEPTHIMDRYYPHGVYNHDKEGRPVAYFPIGGVDAKGIVMNTKASDIYKGIMYWQEQRKWNCEYASNKYGTRIEQATYVIDLMGLSARHLWKPGLDMFIEILHLVEQHTPEIIYRLYIINAPSVFPIMYSLCKPVLDENTKRKIHIYGSDYKDALLEIIDADQLPVYYGGSAVDDENDPECKLHITYGGPVPTNLCQNAEKSSIPQELIELHVKAGTQSLVPIVVMKDDSSIEWFVKSDSTHDFFFGGYKCRSNSDDCSSTNDMEMIVPYFRTFAYYVPESGQCKVDAGKYVFLFDNKHSWLLNKTVKYSIRVVET